MSNYSPYVTKIYKGLPKLLLSKREKQYSIAFFQKKRILKKLKIKSAINENGVLKFSTAYFEATHDCYITHATLYIDKREVVKFTFSKSVIFEDGESMTMDGLSFLLN